MPVIILEIIFYFSPALFNSGGYHAVSVRFLLDVQANYLSYCLIH